MKKIITLLVTGFCMLTLSSQENNDDSFKPAKNVIHGSLGTLFFTFSAHLTYDRFLTEKPNGFFKSYYLTLKGGSVGYVLREKADHLTSVSVTGLTGSGKNHFEVGIGLGYSKYQKTGYPGRFYPQISVGYRKQTKGGLMFRTGMGVLEWAYVGFGFSF